MIRLGLIGAGKWGQNYVRAALEAGNCRVTIAATSHPIDGVECVPSREWKEGLRGRADAYVVATPPETHEEICCHLMARGWPVMVEKPVVLDADRARVLAEFARTCGVPFLVAHQHLFAPAYEELRARVLEWDEFAVISAGGGLGPHRNYSALWDYGPHDVAMFLGLTRHGRIDDDLKADRTGGAFRILLGEGRRTGFLCVWNDAAPKTRRFTVLRHPDIIVYDDRDPGGCLLRHNGRPIPVEPERPLTRAVRAFADACRGKSRDWRFDPFLGVEVTRILAQAEVRTEQTDGEDDHDRSYRHHHG